MGFTSLGCRIGSLAGQRVRWGGWAGFCVLMRYRMGFSVGQRVRWACGGKRVGKVGARGCLTGWSLRPPVLQDRLVGWKGCVACMLPCAVVGARDGDDGASSHVGTLVARQSSCCRTGMCVGAGACLVLMGHAQRLLTYMARGSGEAIQLHVVSLRGEERGLCRWCRATWAVRKAGVSGLGVVRYRRMGVCLVFGVGVAHMASCRCRRVV